MPQQEYQGTVMSVNSDNRSGQLRQNDTSVMFDFEAPRAFPEIKIGDGVIFITVETPQKIIAIIIRVNTP